MANGELGCALGPGCRVGGRTGHGNPTLAKDLVTKRSTARQTYNAANRLVSVTGFATLPSSTGIVTTYTYDGADRLTGISHVKDGSTTVASFAYTLDDVGNRTGRVDQQGTHAYAYADLYRLTSVTYPGPSTTSYAFDAFGNRTSMTDGAGTTS